MKTKRFGERRHVGEKVIEMAGYLAPVVEHEVVDMLVLFWSGLPEFHAPADSGLPGDRGTQLGFVHVAPATSGLTVFSHPLATTRAEVLTAPIGTRDVTVMASWKRLRSNGCYG